MGKLQVADNLPLQLEEGELTLDALSSTQKKRLCFSTSSPVFNLGTTVFLKALVSQSIKLIYSYKQMTKSLVKSIAQGSTTKSNDQGS